MHEYWVILFGVWNAGNRDKDGEAIGIVRVPLNFGSWEIFHEHRPHSTLGTWAKQISQSEYETYMAFGFPVYKYGMIRIAGGGRDSAVYDPRYWELIGGEMIRHVDNLV